MSKARIVGLGFGVLMIVAAFGIVLWQTSTMPATNTAYAQSATATPTAAPSTSPGATPAPQQQQQQPAIGDAFWALLATKTGLSVDDLKAKAVEARKEMIDQAVTDGRATQEQADAIKERITADNIIAPIALSRGGFQGPNNNNQRQPGQNGQGQGQQGPTQRGPFGGFGNGNIPGGIFGRGGFGGGMGPGGLGANLDALNAVATALKLEPKALVEQLSQGKTLADVAKAQGVDEAAVKQAIITYYTGKIDEQLALGLISEANATQLKSQLTPDKIDLSRGFRFQFRLAPGQQMPGMQNGQSFQFGPADGIFSFGQQFGQPSGPQLNISPSDIQTQ